MSRHHCHVMGSLGLGWICIMPLGREQNATEGAAGGYYTYKGVYTYLDSEYHIFFRKQSTGCFQQVLIRDQYLKN